MITSGSPSPIIAGRQALALAGSWMQSLLSSTSLLATLSQKVALLMSMAGPGSTIFSTMTFGLDWANSFWVLLTNP